jgi:FMNH2-dependent dimethyl sulfone monooxygenase
LATSNAAERDALAEYRRQNVPLYNDNRLKLGLFSMNCSGGMNVSTAPSSWTIDWNYHRQLVRRADSLGFELLVPVARWRGMGGETDYTGENYETFTYSSAVAASTENIMVTGTVHAPIIHPLVAAKAGATIDHVSAGRFALNLVMGWSVPEFEMFGIEQRDHEARYQYGAEWIDVVRRLWTDKEPFDYDGEFFQLREAQSKPKPVQPPPPILNAGNSPTGAAWAARHADFNFISFADLDAAGTYTSDIKRTARDEHGRDLGVLTYGLVICRDTEKEAHRVHQQIVDMGDWQAAHTMMSVLGIESGSFTEQFRGPMAESIVAGGGAAKMIGTPEQIAEHLGKIADAGIDGIMLGFLDWNEELEYFGDKVLPLLEQSGLRKPR